MLLLSVFAGSVCLLNEYAKYRYGKDFRKYKTPTSKSL